MYISLSLSIYIYIYVYIYIYIYIYIPMRSNLWPPDGVRTNGVFTEGPRDCFA